MFGVIGIMIRFPRSEKQAWAAGRTAVHPFRNIRFQAVIWTPRFPVKVSRVFSYFLGSYGQLFGGEPFSVDLPPDVPSEIPRAILRSEDGLTVLQASADRLDMIRTVTPQGGAEVQLSESLRLATDLFAGYLGIIDGVAGRLACVLVRASTDDDPAWTLSRHFCRDEVLAGPINRPKEFELHALKRYSLDRGIEVNSWVRCRTGVQQAVAEKPEQRVIVVEQDLNTVVDGDWAREFAPDEMNAFFTPVSAELDRILSLYFPPEGHSRWSAR
jgi:hypothetical protein